MCSNIAEAGLCQGVQAGLAWLGNKLKFLTRMVFIKTTKNFDMWAELSSSSEGSGIFKLGLAWARTYIRFQTKLWLRLEQKILGSMHPGSFPILLDTFPVLTQYFPCTCTMLSQYITGKFPGIPRTNIYQKKLFYCHSSNVWDLDLAGKKHMNYDKYWSCANLIFNLNAFFLSLSTGLTDIFLVYIHDLHHLHEIYNNNKNAMLFIIWTWKAHNLAKNKTSLTEKLKKLCSSETVAPAFCKSVYYCQIIFCLARVCDWFN